MVRVFPTLLPPPLQAIYNIALNADADVTDDGATPLSPYLMTLFVSVMHRADKCVGAMRG